MNNNTVGIMVILGIILAIGVLYCLSQDYPVQVGLSLKPCLGGNVCFLGEDLKLDINLNAKNPHFNGENQTVSIESKIYNKDIPVTVGNSTEITIPLSASLSSGDYEFKIKSFVNLNEDLPTKIRNLFHMGTSDKKVVLVRYPLVKIVDVGYKCQSKGFYFEEIKLKLEDPAVTELVCKFRIYVDKLYVTTNHALLTNREGPTTDFDYYETNYSKINKIDLSGSVQKISFTAGPAVDQTNTKIVPVCLINNKDIEIVEQSITKTKCPVN
jgi:hypothetical protein